MLKYRLNLVKSVRAAEKNRKKQQINITVLAIICFAALGGAVFFANVKVMSMHKTIRNERNRLAMVEAEYRNYQDMHVFIDKTDIELLNNLQSDRIYWTRKLEAMATHLPNEEPASYWITTFGYKGKTFKVNGYGYITGKQEQLLALDTYLTDLRADASYSDVLGSTFLNSAVRSDEEDSRSGKRERVSFDYSSIRK